MTFIKKINEYRRVLTHGLTKNIGNSTVNQNIDLTTQVEIKRVLICRPNARLGNLLLITPLVEEVTSTFPGCKIDLFVKGFLAPIIFEKQENINYIIELPKKPFDNLIAYFKVWVKIKKQHYDIVINVDKGSSSGRLAAQFANSKYKFFGEGDADIPLKYQDYTHMAKYPIYSFRSFLTQLGFPKNENPIPSLNLKLSPSEIAAGKKVLDAIVSKEKKTLCIFTFATGDKCYSESWWEKFYERLKTEYPNYNILEVLPIENVSQIGFKTPSFYSKDIREIGSLIANTELFIGADSGMMHLASSAQTPTVGLFKFDNLIRYQPYNNNSIAIDTNNDAIEEWIKATNKILLKD